MSRLLRWMPVLALAAAMPVIAQKHPELNTTYSGGTPTTTVETPGGIWSKNMELIRPLTVENENEEFPVAKISGGSSEERYLVVTGGVSANNSDPCVRLVKVSNPRSIDADALKIKVMRPIPNEPTEVHEPLMLSVWRDNRSVVPDPSNPLLNITNPLQNHTLVAVHYGGNHHGDQKPPVIIVEEIPGVDPGIKARILIFDLTKALDKVAGVSTKVITIGNANSRSAQVNGTGSTFNDVYIGYIAEDQTPEYNIKPHTMFTEPETGIVILSPSYGDVNVTQRGYVDLFMMTSVASHVNLGSTNPQNFVIPTRIKEVVSGSNRPIAVRFRDGSNNLSVCNAHETFAEPVTSEKIRLYIAAAGDRATGGAVIQDVEFSSPSAATVPYDYNWKFDVDRRSPQYQFSQNTANWNIRNTHSVQPAYFASGAENYLLTTTELSSPVYGRNPDGTVHTFNNGTRNFLYDVKVKDGTWFHPDGAFGDHYDAADFPQPIPIPPETTYHNTAKEDDRLTGNYLRIWNTTTGTQGQVASVVGTTTYNGPIGSYDAIEQDASSPKYTAAKLSPSAISTIVADAGVPTGTDSAGYTADSEDLSVGVNNIHRMHTVKNDPSRDIYLSYYSQGPRIVSLPSDFSSTGTVKEKAYFDFIPTLTFQRAASSNDHSAMSDYFYQNSDAGGYYGDFLRFKNYYLGTWDVKSDFNRTGLEADEKFVYAMGVNGEGYIPANGESSPRNYERGFMILRYFDNKIGGTITGYDGTNSTNDRDYREVNLQGTFAVERDVDVALGCTVNLWDGTVFNKGGGSTPTVLNIYGTVNVETLLEAGRGLIDVQVNVMPGGCLIIKKDANIVFKEKVNVEKGGLWKIEENARVILESPNNICDGKLIILGTSTNRALIQAKPDIANNYFLVTPVTVNNTIIKMKGDRTTSLKMQDSRLEIAYADFKNVYIDAQDITPASPVAITNSTFGGYSTAPGSRYQVGFKYSTATGLDPGPLVVYETSFEDRFGEQTNVSRNSVYYQVGGLFTNNVKAVTIDGSGANGYKYLGWGIHTMNARKVTIKNCEFETCNVGISDVGSEVLVCNNTFDDVTFGVQPSQSQTVTYIGNSFTDSRSGVRVGVSNSQLLRANTFNQYTTAINSTGTLLQMTDLPQGMYFVRWGRNTFAAAPTLDPVYGAYPIDIALNSTTANPAQLRISCGYNSMNNVNPNSASSTGLLHLYSNIATTINTSFNSWPDGTNYGVKKNSLVTTTGTPLNVSAGISAGCSTVTGLDQCVTIPIGCASNPDGGEWITWQKNDLRFEPIYSDAKSYINDTSLNAECRTAHARNAVNVAVLQDSSTKYNELITELNTITGSLSPASSGLKSTAHLLKGHLYERLGELDSATLEYGQIVTTYPNEVDSLAAAWRIQHIGVMQADTLLQDSLMIEYDARVYRDLNRFIDTVQLYARSRVEDDSEILVENPTAGFTTELYQNSPNPFSDKTLLSFSLAQTSHVKLTVTDALGNVIATVTDAVLKAGKYEFPFITENLVSGMYLCRLETDGQVLTQRMIVVK